MRRYYYQQSDEIGKEIAIVCSLVEITDRVNYRPIKKEYFDAVAELLRETAEEQTEEIEE